MTEHGPVDNNEDVAEDFTRRERLPVAIVPDMEYDIDSCFSGNVRMNMEKHGLTFDKE